MLETEALAYWFFRLNGCTTIVNFLVHHERAGREGTEVDILAVRFPFRKELALSGQPMEDHPLFEAGDRIDIVIAEVKRGRCELNGPWTDPTKQNMHRVLYAIGVIPEPHVTAVAQALYDPGSYSDDQCRIRLFAIGERENPNLAPRIVQLCWQDILAFILDQLWRYARVKAQHRQWDETGKELYHEVMLHGSRDGFVQCVMKHLIEERYGD